MKSHWKLGRTRQISPEAGPLLADVSLFEELYTSGTSQNNICVSNMQFLSIPFYVNSDILCDSNVTYNCHTGFPALEKY